jgi:pimeloyl-ACP methyl ester carboxylesterase
MRPVIRTAVVVGTALGGVIAGGLALERRMARRMDGAASPAGWREPVFPAGSRHTVTTDDGAELLVVEAGPAGGPVAVLVHGLTSNSDDWGPVAELLVQQGWHVYALNQRGHGGSTAGRDGYGAKRQGADLAHALAALELSAVTLVGHSMGGIASIAAFTTHPRELHDRVCRLVLVATLARSSRADQRLGLRLIASPEEGDLSKGERAGPLVVRALFGRTPSRAMVGAALASGLRCPEATRRGAALGLRDYDVRAALPRITVPTLVICGTRDIVTPLFENRAIAAAIPNAHLEEIAGAGHLVIWEHPDRIAALIATPAP